MTLRSLVVQTSCSGSRGHYRGVSSTSGPDDAKRFITPFDACASRVFAYVCRHVERNAVEDIVAETFLTAWRRTEGVPEVPLPRLLAMAAI
jgi:hypothetical protein